MYILGLSPGRLSLRTKTSITPPLKERGFDRIEICESGRSIWILLLYAMMDLVGLPLMAAFVIPVAIVVLVAPSAIINRDS